MPNRILVNSASMSLLLFALVAGTATADPSRTVDDVDLDRYMGRWYEIAALPNVFQRDSSSTSSASTR